MTSTGEGLVMKRLVRFLALIGLGLILMVGVLSTTPAGAATPPQVDHGKFNTTLTGISDFCGLTVDIHFQATATFTVYFDSSGNLVRTQLEARVVQTITNEANGKVVYLDGAWRTTDADFVINPDGTITVVETIAGMPERVYTTHSDVLVKDVGLIAFEITFDSTGNFIDQQLIAEHGPHPEADSNFTLFCVAITTAIG